MIDGLDVSHYQSTTPNLHGKDFLFIKATQGITKDSRYDQHYFQARLARVVVGAYHFGIKADGAAQARAFLSVASKADLFALDLEGANPMTQQQGRDFIKTVQAAGHKCGYYHSESGYSDLGQDFNWVANWSNEPTVHWDFWQDGPENGVDHDFFKGTREDLNTLAGIEVSVGPIVTHIQPVVAGLAVIQRDTYAVRVSDGVHKDVKKSESYTAIYTGLIGIDPVFGIVKDTTDFVIGSASILFTPATVPAPDCAAAIAADRATAHIVYG